MSASSVARAIGHKPVSPAQIMELANAYFGSSVLFTAVDLGVFATLANAGKSAGAIAGSIGADQRAARLLLDGCVALGLLEKSGDLYRNTPEAGAFLCPGQPGDLSRALRYNRDVYQAWGRLTEFVRTGKPVELPQLHLGADAERTRTFVLAMHDRASAIGRAVVSQLRLEGKQRLLDVGGGSGAYSMLIAEAFPQIQCTVLDLPPIVEAAAELIGARNCGHRVATLAGDYRTTPFPRGLDAIIFFGVLHQESPESIRDLMGRAHGALMPGGVVYVMEMMTDASHTLPVFSALFGINMGLTKEDGWVFSDAELGRWMEEAGFSDFSVKPLPPPMPHWLAQAHRV